MLTYMIICWGAALYLEFGEQVFYFVACVFGVILWKKNMTKNDDGTEQVIAKKFKPWHWIVVGVITSVTTLLLGYFGDNVLGSTLSYLDALTVALSEAVLNGTESLTIDFNFGYWAKVEVTEMHTVSYVENIK